MPAALRSGAEGSPAPKECAGQRDGGEDSQKRPTWPSPSRRAGRERYGFSSPCVQREAGPLAGMGATRPLLGDEVLPSGPPGQAQISAILSLARVRSAGVWKTGRGKGEFCGSLAEEEWPPRCASGPPNPNIREHPRQRNSFHSLTCGRGSCHPATGDWKSLASDGPVRPSSTKQTHCLPIKNPHCLLYLSRYRSPSPDHTPRSGVVLSVQTANPIPRV